MTFFEEQDGVWSMRRLVAFILVIMAAAVVITGIIISFQPGSEARVAALTGYLAPLIGMGAVALLTFLKE